MEYLLNWFSFYFSQNQITSLHVAASLGLMDTCCDLLDVGVDIEATDEVCIVAPTIFRMAD